MDDAHVTSRLLALAHVGMKRLSFLIVIILVDAASADSLAERERRALEGDPVLAQEIAQERLYFPDQEYWALVAAENGNGLSQYNYGVQLYGLWKRLKDFRDLFRADSPTFSPLRTSIPAQECPVAKWMLV